MYASATCHRDLRQIPSDDPSRPPFVTATVADPLTLETMPGFASILDETDALILSGGATANVNTTEVYMASRSFWECCLAISTRWHDYETYSARQRLGRSCL